MSKLFVKREYKNAKEVDQDFFYEDEFVAESGINESGDKFLGKHLSEKKINIFLVFVVLGIMIIFGRTFQLQVVKGKYYTQLAEINRTREKPIISSRGLIYDNQKRALVKNLPIFDALILPKDLALKEEKRNSQIQTIADLLQINQSEIIEKISKHPKNFNYYISIKENIEYDEAVWLKVQEQQSQGLYIETRNKRSYNYSNEFSHLIGYLGKITEEELDETQNNDYLFNDYIGKTGLELKYETELRGNYGREEIEVDVTGKETKVIYKEEATSGKNIVLTIDSELQKKVREIALKFAAKINKQRISIVMLNPQNGQIIALIGLPDYDNNLFAQGISHEDYQTLINNENNPLFNRVIKGEYPSGSTIKPVVAAGALEEGIVTANTSFMSSGGLWLFERWFFPDWAAGGHGLTNVYKAIAWSVNTYFYIIGGGYEDFTGLGISGLKDYYKLFGLGSKTGIDLIGESPGLVPDPAWKMKVKDEEWYIGDTYHLAIGQGDILVTPLQVANFTSVFANNGKLFEPHLVKELFTNDNEILTIEPKLIRDEIVSSKNINIVKSAMRQAVTGGSAQYLNNLNVAVAGKTGTAQWRTDKNNHAWFTGFAPYENPEVVITVLVEEGGEGSAISVPLTYEILNWYFNEYGKDIVN